MSPFTFSKKRMSPFKTQDIYSNLLATKNHISKKNCLEAVGKLQVATVDKSQDQTKSI